MTLRSLRFLSECDVVLCEDTRVCRSLLTLLQERCMLPKISPKLVSLHSHNEKAFLQEVEESFFEQCVVYLSDAGMPCISDPGAALVRYAQEHKIPYTILPGANAPLTLFAASGSWNKEFLFYGFLPHKQKQRKQELVRLLALGVDVILYESPHRLLASLEEIVSLDSKREIFVGKELSKHFENYYKGRSQEVYARLKDENIRGEWAILIYAQEMQKQEMLCLAELESLELPPKVHAKIMAKMQNRSVKECYEEIILHQS